MTLHETAFGTVESLEWGEGDEVVVLLHALAAGPWAFVPLAGRLQRPGRRIIAPALHGYGGTRVAGADNPVHANVTVARWALGSAGGQRRLLLGHSMGGLTALLAAAGRDDLAALVLFEPIVHAALDRDDPEDRALGQIERTMIQRLRDGVDKGDPEAALAAFIEAWNEARWTALPATLRERLLADAARFAVETAAVADHRVPPDLWAAVATPTTVLYGDRSMALAARMAERLAARLPQARARCIPGLGHMAPALAADVIAEAVESALDPSAQPVASAS